MYLHLMKTMREFCIKCICLISIWMYSSCCSDNGVNKLSGQIEEAFSHPESCIDISEYFESGSTSSLIYLLDLSCSKCMSKYFDFIQDVSNASYVVDSIYVIGYGSPDFSTIDFYASQASLSIPANEKRVIGDSKTIIGLYSLTNNCNVIAVVGGQALFFTNIFNYSYDLNEGLILKK